MYLNIALPSAECFHDRDETQHDSDFYPDFLTAED
jgi:hypothetical protein